MKRLQVLIIGIVSLFVASVAAVSAATFGVDTTSDVSAQSACTASANDCSLRGAIDRADANPGPDTIDFASPFFDTARTINLDRRLTISTDLTITGRGARLLTIRRGGSTGFRIFNIISGTIDISGMTITNGSDGNAGGISNDGTLTLTDVAVTGNTGITSGGGISSSGTLNILNSTISGNNARFLGGGIFVSAGTTNIINSTVSNNSSGNALGGGGAGGIDSAGTLNLTNVTITNNSTASGASGGVSVQVGTAATIKNTIVAANVSNTTNPDVSGAFTSQGYNLVGNAGNATGFTQATDQKGTSATPLDAKLGALANNGGMTDTHALLAGSPAIDKGFSFGSNIDQRGFLRPADHLTIPNAILGDGSDIGACEVQLATAATVSLSGRVTTQSGRGIMNVRLTLTDSNGEVRTTGTASFGYYRFDDVQAGQTVIITAKAKRFNFTPSSVVRTTNESVTDADFISEQ